MYSICRTEPKFGVEYYAVPHKEACPDEAVKCCKGYLLIVGNCLSKFFHNIVIERDISFLLLSTMSLFILDEEMEQNVIHF
jgi:hypothetical protein